MNAKRFFSMERVVNYMMTRLFKMAEHFCAKYQLAEKRPSGPSTPSEPIRPAATIKPITPVLQKPVIQRKLTCSVPFTRRDLMMAGVVC